MDNRPNGISAFKGNGGGTNKARADKQRELTAQLERMRRDAARLALAKTHQDRVARLATKRHRRGDPS